VPADVKRHLLSAYAGGGVASAEMQSFSAPILLQLPLPPLLPLPPASVAISATTSSCLYKRTEFAEPAARAAADACCCSCCEKVAFSVHKACYELSWLLPAAAINASLGGRFCFWLPETSPMSNIY